MTTLGIRVGVDLQNDTCEEIGNLFLGIMNYVNDCGYSIVTGSLNCERFFDVYNHNAKAELECLEEIYNKYKSGGDTDVE